MPDTVQILSVGHLLNDQARYIVPMYQRNYAWGEGEINQLVRDILDYHQKGREQYHIGTLVVFKRDGKDYEIIDGQQRFTTLALLALNHPDRAGGDMEGYIPNIDFESRPKSCATFAALAKRKSPAELRGDPYNESIVNGYELIGKARDFMLEEKINLNDFYRFLFDNVMISRVEVPADTDMNHYFEVMNSRGEQLEKHEIVKAQLMEKLLGDVHARHVLHRVWEACANMERYVQHGFTPDERSDIFDDNWGRFMIGGFGELAEKLKHSEEEGSLAPSLREILINPPAFTEQSQGKEGDKDESSLERFHSVINFSNFLLHVLRIWKNPTAEGDDIALDDKQLIDQFRKHVLEVKEPAQAVKEFTFALLKCKYLFDQYIIKREFIKNDDGWSLKAMRKTSERRSAYFVNSFGEESSAHRSVLMLLSAFHVSTPTQVYKHWLTGALRYLYSQTLVEAEKYRDYLESLARSLVLDRFLAEGGGESYFTMIFGGNPSARDVAPDRLRYGAIENNFVFNWLDYLIWKNRRVGEDSVVDGYEFTFRSSVEHFYPQHPMDGHQKMQAKWLDDFGNLCLISHAKNSRLSNHLPAAKRDHFAASLAQQKIDSLKLYCMLKKMEGANGAWSDKQVQEHGDEMRELLIQERPRP